MRDACVLCAYVCVYAFCVRPTWINQVTRLAIPLRVRSNRRSTTVCRSPHIDRSRDPPGEALVHRKFDQGPNFTAAKFFSSLSRACTCRSDATFVLLDLANVRQIDVSAVSRASRLRVRRTLTRYPIVCYYSCITRYRRAHVVPFARSINSRETASLTQRGSGDLLARIVLGRCESGDERRRLYIKIAFKVGRPRYRFLAFKDL